MKILKKILIVLVVLIGIAGICGMFMPSRLTMERSTIINANEQIVFDQINTLKNWEKWSPWQKMDPTVKMIYNSIPSGLGASYEWSSDNSNTGSGSLTISESVPYSLIKITLDFKENGIGTSDFKLAQAEGGVKLSWGFESDTDSNPFKKLMMNTLGKSFMNKTYDEGLAAIKQIAESMPAPAPETVATPVDSIATMK